MAPTVTTANGSRKTVRKICCIGAGYVGGPTSAVIAKQNPDITVTVVDLSEARIGAWKSNALPIYEPGLFEVVEVARDCKDGRQLANLHFSTDVAGVIDEADLIFIAVNTPTKTEGLGAGGASDLAYVESAARHIAEVATSDKIIVEKSTVPCGTADNIQEILDAHAAPNVHFDILSNPEFLAEGTAMNDLLKPDRVLIGSHKDERSLIAATALADVYAAWVPRDRIITINLWSSELAKLAANCMLAQRISSINSLSAICEATGANIEELAFAVGQDTRIGPKMLKASAGFGGSCFKKDVLSLAYIAETLHLPEVSAYWKSVVDINEYQKERFAKRITKRLYNTLRLKKIAILGFAYKKNTGDTRESAAITIVGQLIAEGAKIAIYDPQVSEATIQQDLIREHRADVVKQRVTVYPDAISACVDASAVVILTEWDEFKTDRVEKAPAAPGTAKQILHAKLNGRSDSSSTTSETGSEFMDSALGTPAPVERERPEYVSHADPADKRVDWVQIASSMKRPRLVFDGRNVVDSEKLASLGFTVECIGKPGIRQRRV
ncbi:Putative UDP-glucose/GDP-mannose dehydrogenase, NAD(P)-binding domain superfamily [Septoria linicola]|uniref:UDP-glucose 6-dehydrogenase n=1 Tax=Septoria linicola TaxID=215465 RepID=A0A9Q9B3H3_9PEZI|nr:putative UDP-glucose/GDP-mannose dehydrogenase, NAD(P)-binding domain superfamily [Septoria linicola]USW56848.1 Putative UDP-glucose/GDP-mannose dehydrogenase, NAD(P)-binding domain superfamily [Septoria linicola]